MARKRGRPTLRKSMIHVEVEHEPIPPGEYYTKFATVVVFEAAKRFIKCIQFLTDRAIVNCPVLTGYLRDCMAGYVEGTMVAGSSSVPVLQRYKAKGPTVAPRLKAARPRGDRKIEADVTRRRLIRGEVTNYAIYAMRRHEEPIKKPGQLSLAQPMTHEGGAAQNKWIERAVLTNEPLCLRYIANSFEVAKQAMRSGRVSLRQVGNSPGPTVLGQP